MAEISTTNRFRENLPTDTIIQVKTKGPDYLAMVFVDEKGRITTSINGRATPGFPGSSYVKARNLLNEVNRNLTELVRVVKGINKAGDYWQDNRGLYEDFMSLKAIFALA
jgi:hypothetical protein